MMTATGAERGVGVVGSKAYQASAPEPPELTLQSREGRSLLPGPEVRCAGCVTRADGGAATVDGGSGERATVVGAGRCPDVGERSAVLPPPLEHPAATSDSAR